MSQINNASLPQGPTPLTHPGNSSEDNTGRSCIAQESITHSSASLEHNIATSFSLPLKCQARCIFVVIPTNLNGLGQKNNIVLLLLLLILLLLLLLLFSLYVYKKLTTRAFVTVTVPPTYA